MNNDTLLLIDLNKNFNLNEKNKQYIYLNNGKINLRNCKQIKLKNFSYLKKDFQKKMINEFKKIIYRDPKNKFFLSEMEFFNLRNDKSKFPDRILNFLIIKKIFYLKNIKKIKIISDNKSTLKVFDNFNLKIEKKDLSKFEFKALFPHLKIIKFLIKTLFLVIFLKFKKKQKIKCTKKNNFYFSIYPNKYSYGKTNFLNKNENFCNFLLTDETHLNFDLKKLIYYANLTHNKNMINIEGYINIFDIFHLLLKHFFNIFFFKFDHLININLEGLNCKKELENIFVSSYINRSKLDIYSKAIPLFLRNNNVSSINLYLFEFSFGFYLIRKIKNFSNKIKISGFQHGIYSDNLMWLDLINVLKHKRIYAPDNIFCLNKYSLKNFRSKFKDIKISIIKNSIIKNKEKRDFINEIRTTNKSNKILVLTGLHDIKDLYFYVKNILTLDKKNIYYFKLHPKNKFLFYEEKNIKKIISFKNINFSNIIISQASSLPYDFLNLNRNFSVVDFDYKQNYISNLLNRNKRIKILNN
tara:strand:- start:1217 stop:2791 length:1575 start_codon:yes stop_codon:yes gene_type:complete